MMQCCFYRHNRGGLKDALPPARLPVYGLTFLFAGTLEYEVDGKPIRLQPGDAVFLQKDCLRARKWISDSDHISFQFETDEPPELPTRICGALTAPVRRFLAAFDEIAEECGDPEDERFAAVLTLLTAQLRAQIRAEREHPLVAAIRRHLAEHLDQRITLADVGRAVSFSASYCQSIFREKTGRSVMDTLLDMRMKKAKELIASREFSLRDVAEKVGFEDYNYFSRQFRARCGVSPSKYRRMFA